MSRKIARTADARFTPGSSLQRRRALCIFGLLWVASGAVGCAVSREAAPSAPALSQGSPQAAGAAAKPEADGQVASKASGVSRKIVRQAELELEVPAPGTAQTAIERLAELHGGYVVSAARDTDHETAEDQRVTLVVRVPQTELTTTIGEVKRLGRGTGSERITSDDVTDEYVDLTARITSQQKLEEQYLEILKRAVTIKDAMDVQKELLEVRTEIERLQGHQHLLDRESAFSTLTVHLTTAVPRIAVSPTTFGTTLRRSWSDSLSLSVDIVTGVVHLVSYLLPILLLLGLPSTLGLWALVRIARALNARSRRPQSLVMAAAD
jgi:Domain of unknown function (DUF4349)